MAQHARVGLRMLRRLAPLLLLLLAAPVRAATVEEIPSPRPAGWTVDRTGRIPADTLRRLDRLGDEVKARTGAELAVVVVGSTGGMAPRAFATRLFNRWGIGDRRRNDGLLVFAALDDHRVEIVLGDGLAGDANRRASEEIVAQEMVPHFLAGDPAGALREGALACARRILGAAPAAEPGDAPASAVAPPPEPALPAEPTPSAAEPPTQSAPDALSNPPSAPSPRPAPASFAEHERTAEVVDGNPLMMSLGILLLVAACGIAGYVYVDRLRHRCPRCRERMEPLDDAAVDALLSPVERTEKRLGSVRFAVWRCAACNEEKRERHVNLFSRYGSCPSCAARALASNAWILEQATYDHGGLERIDQRCENCGYASSYTRSTAQLQRPVDSTSALGSYSSSSSSTSSASDSGFGGGHSSGDGASGSW